MWTSKPQWLSGASADTVPDAWQRARAPRLRPDGRAHNAPPRPLPANGSPEVAPPSTRPSVPDAGAVGSLGSTAGAGSGAGRLATCALGTRPRGESAVAELDVEGEAPHAGAAADALATSATASGSPRLTACRDRS